MALVAVLLGVTLAALAGPAVAVADAGTAGAASPSSAPDSTLSAIQSATTGTNATDEPLDRPAYRLDFDEAGTYSFGVPIATDQTLGDAFVDDMAFEGAVYAYDSDADEWQQVTADHELSALDAYVVRTEEPTALLLRGAGGHDGTDASAPEVELSDGLDFVAAPRRTNATAAFGGDEWTNRSVVAPEWIDPPSASPAEGASFDRVWVSGENPDPANVSDGSDVGVNPFRGYFVAGGNGTLSPAAAPGANHTATSDALNVSRDGPEPFFDVSIQRGMADGPPDDPRGVSVLVENTGPLTLSQDVLLSDGQNGNESVKHRTIEGRSSRSVGFDVNASGWPLGTHTLAVETDDDRATTEATIMAKRTFDTTDPGANGTVNVTVTGTLQRRSDVTLNESFESNVTDATLRSATVDGTSVADSVTAEHASNASFTTSLENVSSGRLALTYEVHLAEGHASLLWESDSFVRVDNESVGLAPNGVGNTDPPAFDVNVVGQNATSTAGADQNVTVEIEHVDGRAGTRTLTLAYGDDPDPWTETFTLGIGDEVRRVITVPIDGDVPIRSYEVNASVETDSETARARVVPERTVQSDTVRPGESVAVTVAGRIESMEGLTLREPVDGPVENVSFQSARVGQTGYDGPPDGSEWNGTALEIETPRLPDGRLEATYHVNVASSAEDDQQISVAEDATAIVETGDGARHELPVHGDRTIDVVAPDLSLMGVGLSEGTSVEHGTTFDVSVPLQNSGSVEGTTDANVTIRGQGRTVRLNETITVEGDSVAMPAFENVSTDDLPTGEYDVVVGAAGSTETRDLTVTGDGSITGTVSLDVVDPDETEVVDVSVEEADVSEEVSLDGDNATGTFALEGLPPSVNQSYTVVANATAYAGDDISDVEVVAGNETDIGTLRLERHTGSVAGTVTENRTGEPIDDATVRLEGFGADGTPNETETTDGDGEYSVANFPVGGHVLNVSAEGYQPREVDVSIDANETAVANVSLDPEPTAEFALSDVSVEPDPILRGENGTVAATVTNVGGANGSQRLRLNVTDGERVVWRSNGTDVELVAGATQTVELEAGTAKLDGGEYQAQLRTANDTAVGNVTVAEHGSIAANVTLDHHDPDENVTVDVAVEGATNATDAALSLNGSSANHTFNGLDPRSEEPVTVVATAENYTTATAEVGVANGTERAVTLELERLTGSIDARVVNESREPIKNATVRLDAFEANATGVENDTATTDASGNATLADVPVGEHGLRVSAPGYENASRSVVVEANGTPTAEFELRSTEDDGDDGLLDGVFSNEDSDDSG